MLHTITEVTIRLLVISLIMLLPATTTVQAAPEQETGILTEKQSALDAIAPLTPLDEQGSSEASVVSLNPSPALEVDYSLRRLYWRSRENPLFFRQGMKGQYLLPTSTQTGILAKLALEKPIELTDAQDVYAWVSHAAHDLAAIPPAQTSCSPPNPITNPGATWTISSDCTLNADYTAPGDVIVTNNAVLTIADGATLYIDLKTYKLEVIQGSGVLIKLGAEIKQTTEIISGLSASNDSPSVLGQETTLMATVSSGTNIDYVWDFGMGNGASASGATVNYPYPAVGTYNATVTASNAISSMTTSTIVTITSASNLSISAQANPEAVLAGQPLTYTLTITNSGPQVANNLIISNTLPLYASYIRGGDKQVMLSPGQ